MASWHYEKLHTALRPKDRTTLEQVKVMDKWPKNIFTNRNPEKT